MHRCHHAVRGYFVGHGSLLLLDSSSRLALTRAVIFGIHSNETRYWPLQATKMMAINARTEWPGGSYPVGYLGRTGIYTRPLAMFFTPTDELVHQVY